MKLHLILLCFFLSSCGLNDDHTLEAIRLLAPDKLGINWRFDEENQYRGWSGGFSWDLD